MEDMEYLKQAADLGNIWEKGKSKMCFAFRG